MFDAANVFFVTDSVELFDHDRRRRVPPMSADARERLQLFADEHVKTADFQRRLAETRRRMEDDQGRLSD